MWYYYNEDHDEYTNDYQLSFRSYSFNDIFEHSTFDFVFLQGGKSWKGSAQNQQQDLSDSLSPFVEDYL